MCSFLCVSFSLIAYIVLSFHVCVLCFALLSVSLLFFALDFLDFNGSLSGVRSAPGVSSGCACRRLARLLAPAVLLTYGKNGR